MTTLYFLCLIASMNEQNDEKVALLIIESPKASASDRNWATTAANLQSKAQQAKDIQEIAENVWQIPLHSGLLILSQMIELAHKGDLKVRVLFFEEPPNWSVYPPAEKPNA